MMAVDLDPSSFPSFAQHLFAKWRPVLLEPISGSYERLVIGCAVANQSGFHLEMANALSRLNCLYPIRAEAVLFAVELAEKALKHDLAERGMEALHHPRGLLSGVVLGEMREAEGAGLAEIGRDWMAVLSSLYDPESAQSALGQPHFVKETQNKTAREDDRLPQLVLKLISSQKIEIARYFSSRIVDGGIRRKRSAVHEVDIDYRGRRLVANFATLTSGRLAPAVGNIKQRLYDLKVDRERDTAHDGRTHELIVQMPGENDPQISKKQFVRLQAEYNGLMEQADDLQLRLRPFTTAEEIGKHIIEKEAA
jgi:hypothetical protein